MSFLRPLSDRFDRIEALIESDSRVVIQTLLDSLVDTRDERDEITITNHPHYRSN